MDTKSPNTSNEMNGSWRNWLLGVVASVVAAAIIGGLNFQRETKGALERHEAMIHHLESYGPQFNRPDADREFHVRDLAIQRLERRIEQLEQRGR